MSRPVVGGWRTVPGSIQPFGALEHNLLDFRAKMKESNEIYHHASQTTVLKNYGDLESEMFSERTTTVNTPTSGTAYTHFAGTPLFIRRSRADVHRLAGLVGNNPATGVGTAGNPIILEKPANVFNLVPGLKININGVDSTIVSVVGANGIEIDNPFPAGQAPGSGAQITSWGRDVANPHLGPIYKLTDKYGSHVLDQNRYQVDYETGLVRYRPINGTFNGNDSIWHPENTADKPYYFGREIDLSQMPPEDIPGQDNIPDRTLTIAGSTTTVVELGAAGIAAIPNLAVGERVRIGFDERIVTAVGATNITLASPLVAAPVAGLQATFIDRGDAVLPNNFTNLRITAPAGTVIEVQLNGGILASTSDASRGLYVPFYDNNPDNDNLKVDDQIDPDNYIYKYLRKGSNNLVIKATRPNNVAARGVKIEGFDAQRNIVAPLFAGVNIDTTGSELSADPLDWSTSQHSVLGVAGKISFAVADRNHLEDMVDFTEQNNGVLESLTSMLADLDINHLKSLLAVIR